MTDRHRPLLAAAILSLALATTAAAQSPPAAAPEPPPNGFRADYLRELARLEERALALAEVIPAERWAEPPGPGIHPFGECLAGVGTASRGILLGMERPVPPAAGEGPAAVEPAAAETAVEAAVETAAEAGKARQIEDLAAVLAAVRRAVEETPDDGLEAPIDFLGRRWTVRALFLLHLAQAHEALGHAAAHAEALGVPPPWIRKRRLSEATGDD